MDKDTLYVNLFAGPSTGKSTTAAGIFNLLKLHDVDAEIVTEFAKDLVWEGRAKTMDNQRYLYGKQHHRIWRLNKSVDVVVTDSPLLLSLVYGSLNSNVSEDFFKDVKKAYNEFNNINFFLKRTKKYNPNGRNQNEDEAKEIDNLIKTMLEENNYNYESVLGTHEAVNIITNVILNLLGKEIEYNVTKIA